LIRDKTLEELSLEEYHRFSKAFQDDIYDAISLESCVNRRNTTGAPGTEAMKKEIEFSRSRIEELMSDYTDIFADFLTDTDLPLSEIGLEGLFYQDPSNDHDPAENAPDSAKGGVILPGGEDRFRKGKQPEE